MSAFGGILAVLMISLDLHCQSLLLPAAGLIALAAHSPSNGAPEEPPVDRERETIRVRNSVRPIMPDEEGFPLDRLPTGVYGFSYSPATEALPLFGKHTVGSFEVHKPVAGSPQVLGYLTPQEAEAFERGELQDVKLYPEPNDNSRTLLAIPSERVVRAKGPSRSDGNYLSITIR
jgi:hypothetical protein